MAKVLTADGSTSWTDHEAVIHLAMTSTGGDYELGWWAPTGREEDREATHFAPTSRKGRKRAAVVRHKLWVWGYPVLAGPDEIFGVFPFDPEAQAAFAEGEAGMAAWVEKLNGLTESDRNPYRQWVGMQEDVESL